MHVGLEPEGGNKLTYDFKKERYTPMDKEPEHHIRYIDESEKE